MNNSKINNAKKGQVTVFVIAGIILVLMVALFFLLRPQLEVEEAIEFPLELQPINDYVDECLKQTAMNGLNLLGSQGGVIFVNESQVSNYYGNISYGYYQGSDVLHSLGFMENELSKYISLSLPSCIDFTLFNNFNISTEGVKSGVTIGTNEVIVEVSYPIYVSSSGYEGNLERFIYKAPIRLSQIHNTAKLIIDRTIQEPKFVDMTYLSGFELKVDIIPYDLANFIYSFSDESFLISGEPYVFLFANKFVVNQEPVLDIPDTLKFKDGVAVSMQLNATDPEGDVLTFSDDTPMFDISEDGVILFVPEVPGEFDVIITVEDSADNMVSKIVKIVIE